MTNVYKPLPIESVERAQVMLRLQILRIFHRVEASQLGRRILYLCTHFVRILYLWDFISKLFLKSIWSLPEWTFFTFYGSSRVKFHLAEPEI